MPPQHGNTQPFHTNPQGTCPPQPLAECSLGDRPPTPTSITELRASLLLQGAVWRSLLPDSCPKHTYKKPHPEEVLSIQAFSAPWLEQPRPPECLAQSARAAAAAHRAWRLARLGEWWNPIQLVPLNTENQTHRGITTHRVLPHASLVTHAWRHTLPSPGW